jgi:hypothetical protein
MVKMSEFKDEEYYKTLIALFEHCLNDYRTHVVDSDSIRSSNPDINVIRDQLANAEKQIFKYREYLSTRSMMINYYNTIKGNDGQ